MFTLRCSSCNAQLAVKSEKLIGQIVACPKCGSMVLIQPPQSEAPPVQIDVEQEVPRPTMRFPDAMTSRSPENMLFHGILTEKNNIEGLEVVPESELRFRKILLGILLGFVIALLLFAGILLLFQRQNMQRDDRTVSVPIAEPQKTDELVPKTQPKTQPEMHPEKTTEETAVPAPQPKPEDVQEQSVTVSEPTEKPLKPDASGADAGDKLAELLAKPPVEEPKIEKPDGGDVLGRIQHKMPDLLKGSAELTLDIPNILNLPVKKWVLNKTPLLNVLRQFSELTDIMITLDIDELFCREITADTPISIVCEDGTAGDFLKQILQSAGLVFAVKENQITVSVPESERNKIVEQSFAVADIAAVLPVEILADYIRQLVIFPAGTSLKVQNDSITVQHTKKHVRQVLYLLEQLRFLHGVKQTTEIPPEKLVPESFGWDAVCVPITLNYYQPEPLADVLQQIEKAAKIKILVDNRSLQRSLVSVKTLTASVRCNNEPADTALQRLLSSADEAELSYRIVSADVIEITTADELLKPDKMSIEIHRFETEEKKLSETPEEFVRALKTAVVPESWASAENPDGGVIVIDKQSGCLFVRQNQSVQRELRRLF
ncbi:MAG: hypothetical protein FWE67_01550 [Planctomycetaceae bacterium]|nr:hypothetical protein [Planctomycetaceae bacterium]